MCGERGVGLLLLGGYFRFIPARAGNGPTVGTRSGIPSVHPRACGERCSSSPADVSGIGSSPRVRGTESETHAVGLPRRFIPARAGNGRLRLRNLSSPTVHPRACGERLSELGRERHGFGSSPRVRGTVGFQCRVSEWGRFIPARAGNGSAPPPKPSIPSVHPRACGERAGGSGSRFSNAGSSPRVRGTGREWRVAPLRLRFIPARAGNGPDDLSPVLDVPVHPRACGERSIPFFAFFSRFGSSPRVRGTVLMVFPIKIQPRFIPARAGNGNGR